jgi:hypothetical protein
MTPAVSALIIVLNGHMSIAELGLSRAHAPIPGAHANCFEYVSGAPGYTLFVDTHRADGIFQSVGYADQDRCETMGRAFKPDVPWVCAPLAPPAKPCLES